MSMQLTERWTICRDFSWLPECHNTDDNNNNLFIFELVFSLALHCRHAS